MLLNISIWHTAVLSNSCSLDNDKVLLAYRTAEGAALRSLVQEKRGWEEKLGTQEQHDCRSQNMSNSTKCSNGNLVNVMLIGVAEKLFQLKTTELI